MHFSTKEGSVELSWYTNIFIYFYSRYSNFETQGAWALQNPLRILNFELPPQLNHNFVISIVKILKNHQNPKNPLKPTWDFQQSTHQLSFIIFKIHVKNKIKTFIIHIDIYS